MRLKKSLIFAVGQLWFALWRFGTEADKVEEMFEEAVGLAGANRMFSLKEWQKEAAGTIIPAASSLGHLQIR